MGLSVFLGVGTPGLKADRSVGQSRPYPSKIKNDNRRAFMEYIIKSTSGSRGDMKFEDLGDNLYKVTVTNGLLGDRAVTVSFTVTKEEMKRLGKAS